MFLILIDVALDLIVSATLAVVIALVIVTVACVSGVNRFVPDT